MKWVKWPSWQYLALSCSGMSPQARIEIAAEETAKKAENAAIASTKKFQSTTIKTLVNRWKMLEVAQTISEWGRNLRHSKEQEWHSKCAAQKVAADQQRAAHLLEVERQRMLYIQSKTGR